MPLADPPTPFNQSFLTVGFLHTSNHLGNQPARIMSRFAVVQVKNLHHGTGRLKTKSTGCGASY
jgi:hypothetical protein